MQFRVTHKILTGYVLGFLLLLAFALLTFFNGKQIEATTQSLAEEKLPGLVAVSALKTGLQFQTIQLYELYATNDTEAFKKAHQQSMIDTKSQLELVKALPQFSVYQSKIDEQLEKQNTVTAKFFDLMSANEVDWDGARNALAEFSKGNDTINFELDALVKSIRADTLQQAQVSTSQIQTLINAVLILTVVIFLGIFAVAYMSHKQVAVPLEEMSSALASIASRKDLTYRVRQYGNDEVGEISSAVNKLLDEFQRLARALDTSTQELNRTAHSLISATDEIHQDAQSSQRQLGSIKVISGKLQGLSENLQGQFRLLNF